MHWGICEIGLLTLMKGATSADGVTHHIVTSSVEVIYTPQNRKGAVLISDNTSQPGIVMVMGPAKWRPRYILTSSLISWTHAQNDP